MNQGENFDIAHYEREGRPFAKILQSAREKYLKGLEEFLEEYDEANNKNLFLEEYDKAIKD